MSPPRQGEFFAIPINHWPMQVPSSRIAAVLLRLLTGLHNGLRPVLLVVLLIGFGSSDRPAALRANGPADEVRFFEQRIRPLLVEHCYECHSEEAGEQQGGLLLDRQSGWMEGGETNKAVIPGEPDASLLFVAIRYDDDELQMPPDGRLDDEVIDLFQQWIRRGAPGPAEDMGETEFSRLGDQNYLFDQATTHWAFNPIRAVTPPPLQTSSVPPKTSPSRSSDDQSQKKLESRWSDREIDRFVWNALHQVGVVPSGRADAATLVRRLSYDLTGLPPTFEQVVGFVEAAEVDFDQATSRLIDQLIESPEYGQHLGRLWLDVVRYADTDNDYRPDTKTPHYYPFAFSYRDYVVDSLNSDKPFDQFLKEQLAADLMGFPRDAPEMAALGFYATGPYANRAQTEAFDDWIDVTTRGLMGMTVACARCHDHKFEPVPTADYYSLRGVFAAVTRGNPLDEKKQPLMTAYSATDSEVKDYQRKRAAIDAKISEATGKKSKGNNRSVAEKIRETELAELLTFHPGAPARAMVVSERGKPPEAFIFVRGDAAARGDAVPRRFLQVLDPSQIEFPSDTSGRLELAEKIASSQNPLTARVFVNRVWGQLIGSHLVATPSDFGLQGSPPTHPELLDWLADDFVRHGWSVKHLVRRIVSTETYRQSSGFRESAAAIDSENTWLWRANRKHLSIEAIRDSMLLVSGQLIRRVGGHAEPLWGKDYTRRRAVYGFINRFNLDPTLRAFDFPAPVQSQPARGESIVAQQALFTLNAPFVIDQAAAIVSSDSFARLKTNAAKTEHLFRVILVREPAANEAFRALKLVEFQQRFEQADQKSSRFINSPWPLIAQALLMSNEFQYVD